MAQQMRGWKRIFRWLLSLVGRRLPIHVRSRLGWRTLGLCLGVLVTALTMWGAPVKAQLLDLFRTNPAIRQPSINIVQLGDIDLADITLDGRPLFTVAASTAEAGAETNVQLPIERRVLSIEAKLDRIITTGFDREFLDVRTGVLNNQQVILVGERVPRLSVARNFSTENFAQLEWDFEDVPVEDLSPVREITRGRWNAPPYPPPNLEEFPPVEIQSGFVITPGNDFSDALAPTPSSYPLISRVVVTVTDQDVEFTGQSAVVIARERANTIYEALLQAQEERTPAYLQEQLVIGAGTLLWVTGVSVGLMLVQRLFRARWNYLTAKVYAEDSEEFQLLANTPMPWDSPVNPSTELKQLSRSLPELQGWHQLPGRLWLAVKTWLGGSSPLWEKLFPTFSLVQRQNINLLVRSMLWWGQTALWVWGISSFLQRFPFSRSLASWLFSVPVKFLLIWCFASVGRRLADITVSVFLHRWAERRSLSTLEARRIRQRVPTIARALKELTSILTFVVTAFWFLYQFNTPFLPVLLGAGLVGVGSQNLIKDWLAGLFILWEDQYARGDVVIIEGTMGKVEYMNLRMTQLRTPDGELVSIANGSFDQVKNTTNRWSRVNLGVEVAYKTDLDKAIAVIEAVAFELEADAEWGRWILEPPKMLGVDEFGTNSVTIRMWIKTRPMRQWDVEREFRRRLKEEFDRTGITIPFPQRSIWLENAFPPQEGKGD